MSYKKICDLCGKEIPEKIHKDKDIEVYKFSFNLVCAGSSKYDINNVYIHEKDICAECRPKISNLIKEHRTGSIIL